MLRRKVAGILTIAISAAMICTACGSGNQQSPAAAQDSSAKEASAEQPSADSSAADESAPAEADAAADASAEAEKPADTAAVHPYAWMGLEDIPSCKTLDIMSTNHYIWTYDAYTMSMSTKETEAIDGVNSYKKNSSQRTYSINGTIFSINDSSKQYMKVDMSDSIETAKSSLESAMANGTNYSGRSFVGTGKEKIPEYCELEEDDTKYDFYEYNYPDMTDEGSNSMTEKYYMKGGDVFAIYQKTSLGDTDYEYVRVIKNISADIPDGTFKLPNLEGYEEMK